MAISIAFLMGVMLTIVAFAMAAMAREKQEKECAFFGWMARDRDGEAWVHETEPEKDLESGQWVPKSGLSMRVYPEQMKSIRWTDDKATRVCLTIDRERRYGDE